MLALLFGRQSENQGMKFCNLSLVSCPHIRPSLSSPAISAFPFVQSLLRKHLYSRHQVQLAVLRAVCRVQTEMMVAATVDSE